MVAQASVAQTDLTSAPKKAVAKKPVPFGGSRFLYVFHSENAGRGLYVDYPGERAFDPDDDPARRREGRIQVSEWERRWPDEKDREVLREAFYATGGKIKFKKVTESLTQKLVRSHGVLETNDPNIAQVVRWAIQKGTLEGVREIDQSRVWKVGNQEFANNAIGRAAADKYHAEHEDLDIALVKRGA